MKRLISLRIREDLLAKVDKESNEHNEKNKHTFYDGFVHYWCGYKSRADIIETALKEYFEKRNT